MLDIGSRDDASRHAVRYDDQIGGGGLSPAAWPKQDACMSGFVYMLASKRNGTLYAGVTSDVPRRVWEHKEGTPGGFTVHYGVKSLIWYGEFPWIIDAIAREKAIKNWPRDESGVEGPLGAAGDVVVARHSKM